VGGYGIVGCCLIVLGYCGWVLGHFKVLWMVYGILGCFEWVLVHLGCCVIVVGHFRVLWVVLWLFRVLWMVLWHFRVFLVGFMAF